MTKIREHSYAVIKHWVVLMSGIASLVLSLLERFRRSCRRRSPAEIVTQTTDCPVRFGILGIREVIYCWFAEGVKNQPYATRYTKFLENLEKIIPNCMRFQAELEGDLVVLHVFSYERYDLSLPWSQQGVQPASIGKYRPQIRY